MYESLIGKSKNKNQVECKNLNLNWNNKKNDYFTGENIFIPSQQENKQKKKNKWSI